jgi:hypothetical protein
MGRVTIRPEGERDDEEADDQPGLRRGEDDHHHAEGHRHQRQDGVYQVLRRQTVGLVQDPLQLGPGNAGTGEGDRADQRTDDGKHDRRDGMRVAPGELDGGNRRRGAAAHAVVDGDHLRHVGHLDPLAGNPRAGAADDQREDHQAEVLQSGNEEGGGDRDQHAVTGNDDAAPRRGGRTHALQAEDEEQRADEPGALDVDGYRHVQSSFFLNMPSMRSVTT